MGGTGGGAAEPEALSPPPIPDTAAQELFRRCRKQGMRVLKLRITSAFCCVCTLLYLSGGAR